MLDVSDVVQRKVCMGWNRLSQVDAVSSVPSLIDKDMTRGSINKMENGKAADCQV